MLNGQRAPRTVLRRRGSVKVWLVGVALLAGVTANHTAGLWRRQSVPAAEGVGAPLPTVRAEGAVAGHAQIGVVEDEETARGLLTFALLGLWDFDAQRPSECPAAVRAFDGRRVTVTGFMYPLEAGQRLRSFCLLRTTQTCCYGPRPQYSQYLLVEMAEPVTFERLAPVRVTGRFSVDARPAEGYIYRLDGESVAAAEPERPEVEGADVARRLKLPRLDFAWLAATGPDDAPLSAELLALDGRRVVAEGFVVDREGESGRLTLAKAWWDGNGQGTPPTLRTAVTVTLSAGVRPPPAWRPRCVVTGTVRVTREPADRRDCGLVTLTAAVCGEDALAAGGRRGGPYVPVGVEAAVFAVWAGWVAFARRRSHGS